MSNSNSGNALDFVDWDELKGKEARGVDKKVDLGEIQGIGRTYVVTQKGIVSKDKFYIPKALAEKYDGKKVWFNVSETLKEEFRRQNPPTEEEIAKYRTADSPTYVDDKIVVVSEAPTDEVTREVTTSEDTVTIPTTVTTTTTETSTDAAFRKSEPAIIDWDKVIHKNVRSMDGEPIGKILALYPDSIHIESQGSRIAYEIPKSEVEGFDGAEVRLRAPIVDLERYVKRR